MRNVKLGTRIVALAAVAFFVVALITGSGIGIAGVTVTVVTVLTTVIITVDQATRRHRQADEPPAAPSP